MNGPQNYTGAVNCWKKVSGDAPEDMALLAEGQLLATLALTAAVIEVGNAISAAAGGTMFPSNDWSDVIA